MHGPSTDFGGDDEASRGKLGRLVWQAAWLVAGWWFGGLMPKKMDARAHQGSPDATRRGPTAERPCSRWSIAPAVLVILLLLLLLIALTYVNIA